METQTEFKQLTLEDYTYLCSEDMKLVDAWLDKYNVKTASLIKQCLIPVDDFETYIVLEAFGPNFPRVFYTPTDDPHSRQYIADDLLPHETGPSYEAPPIKMARFCFDDFPWEVLDNG